MIYIEPRPLDAQFCENIEPMSIIVSDRFDEMEVRAFCSFDNVIILPFTHQTVLTAVQQVLIENGIIGAGYGQKKFGDLWHEMLCLIPLIQDTYAEAIAASVPNPYTVIHNLPAELCAKGGNRIPARVLDRLRFFFETENPNDRLETRHRKKRRSEDL
jgi:hypothetical protein